jgi:hypothetical protein
VAKNSNPRSHEPDNVEREFAETLRQAAYIFENEKNGRFLGSILACRAVARFIYLRNGGAELAGPFLQISEAFAELERGGKPRLFAKKTIPEKERERSPERKQIQMLAAAALEVLIKLEPRGQGSRKAAADKIARHVNRWPGMGAQDVTGLTVVAWRNQQRNSSQSARKPFERVVTAILGEPDPIKKVDELLKSGPPGHWKS